LLGVLLAAAGVALVGCQPAPGAAAFVGDRRVTDQQLQDDVNEELAVPQIKQGVTQQYGEDLSAFRRQLLNDRIMHELVTEAVARTGVQIPAGDVQQAIDNDGGFDKIRDDGHLSHDLALRRYQDLIAMAELGYAKQGVPRPTEASLRALYAQAAQQQRTAQLGLISVPDQATLDRTYTQLQASPDQFDKVAAQFPGSNAKPAPYTPDGIPDTFEPQVFGAKPGALLKYAQPGSGQFLVVKVFGVSTPTFEQLRFKLSLPSIQTALQGGLAYVGQLSQQLGVRVSPRYGTWDPKKAQIADTPDSVVTLNTPKPAATPTVPVDPGAPAGS
jgi:peptidyl-prolyl cis-trans isomerase SurA